MGMLEPEDLNVDETIKRIAESEPWEAVDQGFPYKHIKALALKSIELEKRIAHMEEMVLEDK